MKSIEYNERYNAIAGEIGYNVQFTNAAIAISTNLDDIIADNTAIQSGQSSATRIMPQIISDTLANVEFCLQSFLTTFLTEEQQNCYLDGDCVIDEIVSVEVLSFYNALQRVKLFAQTMNGIIKSIPTIEDIRFTASGNDYILTEEEFDEDANIVQNTTNFTYYEVLEGDTSRIIALRELNDQEKYTQILRLNDLTESDFIEGTLTGKKIKIPVLLQSTSRGVDNLVYEGSTENLELYLFGSDISTKDGKLKVSETGDLLHTSGVENAYENIENKIASRKGSLNVFNPNFGTIALDDGNAPLLVKIDRYITDVINQIQDDPRVESVQVDFNKLQYDGSSLTVPSKVFFLGVDQPREVVISG